MHKETSALVPCTISGLSRWASLRLRLTRTDIVQEHLRDFYLLIMQAAVGL